ncbi:MAG: aspartate ammonia-lyase [Candidatus Ranarchaeia archaeon]
MAFRIEKDSLGELKVPADALYGVQTIRAVNNFPVTGAPPHPEFIQAYAIVKKCAAKANQKSGNLSSDIAEPIIQACDEIFQGKHLSHFVVDRLANITSFNMNMNEVVANRALEILGQPKGSYRVIHPNDHVNMSQSTNDTFPTAMSLSILLMWPSLKKTIELLRDALWLKGEEFMGIIKSARTHLQDAVPTSLGLEFRAYGTALDQAIQTLAYAIKTLRIVPIGGTAAGTAMNTPQNYIEDFLKFVEEEGYTLSSHSDLPYIQHSRSNIGLFSSALKTLALELIRIANDLRLLSSGPTSGLAEIKLPAVQPGSSIMPGKVNPVMAESLNMLSFYIVGNDTTVALAVQAGQLELNVMMPVMIDVILSSIKMLTRFLPVFTKRCVEGISPNLAYIERNIEKNPSIATFLNTIIGYDKSSEIAKQAIKEGKSIKTVLLEQNLFSKQEIDRIFSADSLLPRKKMNK